MNRPPTPPFRLPFPAAQLHQEDGLIAVPTDHALPGCVVCGQPAFIAAVRTFTAVEDDGDDPIVPEVKLPGGGTLRVHLLPRVAEAAVDALRARRVAVEFGICRACRSTRRRAKGRADALILAGTSVALFPILGGAVAAFVGAIDRRVPEWLLGGGTVVSALGIAIVIAAANDRAKVRDYVRFAGISGPWCWLERASLDARFVASLVAAGLLEPDGAARRELPASRPRRDGRGSRA